MVGFYGIISMIIYSRYRGLKPIYHLSSTRSPTYTISFYRDSNDSTILSSRTLERQGARPPHDFRVRLTFINVTSIIMRSVLLFRPIASQGQIGMRVGVYFCKDAHRHRQSTTLLWTLRRLFDAYCRIWANEVIPTYLPMRHLFLF